MSINLRRDTVKQRKLENKEDLNLNYKKVCITGTIPGKTRFQAQNILREKFPNITFDNVMSTRTNYLLTGFGIGQTKLRFATKYKIPIIEAVKFFS